ncbi:MAG: 1-acyl-sn-glycerol-3-phosphate acyltransferase [Lachnospiraceae bacterium]|nr:1-acyl-sn-glycerol-3-phosphate acyltransferase [Lachnospiraceae bacterium]
MIVGLFPLTERLVTEDFLMRMILVGLFLLLYFTASLVVLPVLWIIGRFNLRTKNYISFKIVRWAFRVILFIVGAKLTVIGEENIPDDRSVLFMGNHRSNFDALIHYVNVKIPMGFISKKEVKKVPLLNIWMDNINCLFLDRDDIKQGMQMVLDAINMIKKGIGICIFPEGTRCKKEGELLPFKSGSFKIATKSKCDIVPFAINNSAALFEDSPHRFFRKANVVIEYGAPIQTSEMSREDVKELPDKVRDIIAEMIEKNAAKEAV